MRKTAFTVLLAGALASTSAPAGAQVPADTRYAGGDVVDRPAGKAFNGRVGDVNVSLRTVGTSRIQAGATVVNACGRVPGQVNGVGTGAVAPDGTFTVRTRRVIGRRYVDRLVISGRVAGARVSGTVASTTHLRRGGRRICKGTAQFSSVTPPALGATAAPPPAGTVLRGALNVGSFIPYEFVMRVAADGRSITRVMLTAPYRCNGRAGAQSFYEVGTAIGPDGRFRIVNPFADRLGEGLRERGRTVISGRFVEGGVVGAVTVSSRVTRRGRTVLRCASGERGFSAIP